MANLTRYVVTVALVSETNNPAVAEPTVTLIVDAAHGAPVLAEINFTGAPGVSAIQQWATLDVNAMVDALPKVGTALDAPPSRVIDVTPDPPVALLPRSGRPMVKCPACKRQVATLKNGGLHQHNTKRLGGVLCEASSTPAKVVEQRASRPQADRKAKQAPDDILELFANAGDDAAALGKLLGVHWKTIDNWVRHARQKDRRLEELRAAELHNPPGASRY